MNARRRPHARSVHVLQAWKLQAGDRLLNGTVLEVRKLDRPEIVAVTMRPDEGDIVEHHYLAGQRLRIIRERS